MNHIKTSNAAIHPWLCWIPWIRDLSPDFVSLFFPYLFNAANTPILVASGFLFFYPTQRPRGLVWLWIVCIDWLIIQEIIGVAQLIATVERMSFLLLQPPALAVRLVKHYGVLDIRFVYNIQSANLKYSTKKDCPDGQSELNNCKAKITELDSKLDTYVHQLEYELYRFESAGFELICHLRSFKWPKFIYAIRTMLISTQ